MGQPPTQSCPIYLKQATQQARDCLRLDWNGHWPSSDATLPSSQHGLAARPTLPYLHIWSLGPKSPLAGVSTTNNSRQQQPVAAPSRTRRSSQVAALSRIGGLLAAPLPHC